MFVMLMTQTIVGNNDQSIHPKKIPGKKERIYINNNTCILLVHSVLQRFIYLIFFSTIIDFWSTYVKYTEGFMMLPTGNIITKPYELWNPEQQKPLQV